MNENLGADASARENPERKGFTLADASGFNDLLLYFLRYSIRNALAVGSLGFG